MISYIIGSQQCANRDILRKYYSEDRHHPPKCHEIYKTYHRTYESGFKEKRHSEYWRKINPGEWRLEWPWWLHTDVVNTPDCKKFWVARWFFLILNNSPFTIFIQMEKISFLLLWVLKSIERHKTNINKKKGWEWEYKIVKICA